MSLCAKDKWVRLAIIEHELHDMREFGLAGMTRDRRRQISEDMSAGELKEAAIRVEDLKIGAR